MTADNRSFIEVLENKLDITKAARFNAYRRLKTKESLSSWAITLWSSFLLLVSIQSVKGDLYIIPQEWLNISGVAGSVFILVLSLLEQNKCYGANAEHLHYSAKFVNQLYSELREAKSFLAGQSLSKSVHDISVRYHEHITSCGLNHDPIDMDEYFLNSSKVSKWQYIIKWCIFKIEWAKELALYYVLFFSIVLILLVAFVYKFQEHTNLNYTHAGQSQHP